MQPSPAPVWLRRSFKVLMSRHWIALTRSACVSFEHAHTYPSPTFNGGSASHDMTRYPYSSIVFNVTGCGGRYTARKPPGSGDTNDRDRAGEKSNDYPRVE